VQQSEREEFAQSVGLLSDFWIANEPPRVFPNIAEQVGREGPKGSFLLSVNGVPVAWTDPHGASVDWMGATPPGQIAVYGQNPRDDGAKAFY
jgi:hypothetical protein